MCLITKQRAPEVAEEAITCYKAVDVLSRKEDIPEVFRSQYYLFCYELGKTYELDDWSKSISFDNDCIPLPDPSGNICVSRGFHSFGRQVDAIRDIFDKNYEVILKCEIPKGARYWTGNQDLHDTDPNYREYCSERIRVVGWKFAKAGAAWQFPEQKEEEPGVPGVAILK